MTQELSHFMRTLTVATVATVAAGILAIGTTTSVRADAAAAEKALAFVEVLTVEGLGLLGENNPDNAVFEEQFRTFITKAFDVPFVGRVAMGTYWRRATPEQQTEYQILFRDYIVKTYAERFRLFSGETLEITDVIEVDEDETIVRTEIVRPDDPNISVDWHVRTSPESSLVLDVIIEGLRLTRTLNEEFSNIIRIGGGDVEVLLQLMRDRAVL
jgi:phospholipid transport system substrate-binding protein